MGDDELLFMDSPDDFSRDLAALRSSAKKRERKERRRRQREERELSARRREKMRLTRSTPTLMPQSSGGLNGPATSPPVSATSARRRRSTRRSERGDLRREILKRRSTSELARSSATELLPQALTSVPDPEAGSVGTTASHLSLSLSRTETHGEEFELEDDEVHLEGLQSAFDMTGAVSDENGITQLQLLLPSQHTIAVNVPIRGKVTARQLLHTACAIWEQRTHEQHPAQQYDLCIADEDESGALVIDPDFPPLDEKSDIVQAHFTALVIRPRTQALARNVQVAPRDDEIASTDKKRLLLQVHVAFDNSVHDLRLSDSARPLTSLLPLLGLSETLAPLFLWRSDECGRDLPGAAEVSCVFGQHMQSTVSLVLSHAKELHEEEIPLQVRNYLGKLRPLCPLKMPRKSPLSAVFSELKAPPRTCTLYYDVKRGAEHVDANENESDTESIGEEEGENIEENAEVQLALDSPVSMLLSPQLLLCAKRGDAGELLAEEASLASQTSFVSQTTSHLALAQPSRSKSVTRGTVESTEDVEGTRPLQPTELQHTAALRPLRDTSEFRFTARSAAAQESFAVKKRRRRLARVLPGIAADRRRELLIDGKAVITKRPQSNQVTSCRPLETVIDVERVSAREFQIVFCDSEATHNDNAEQGDQSLVVTQFEASDDGAARRAVAKLRFLLRLRNARPKELSKAMRRTRASSRSNAQDTNKRPSMLHRLLSTFS
ncbi:MAG: hypothetical protein MHM6MM_005753 [Cercozoa sp. M6MM]